MERRPLPLLKEFLDRSLPFPALQWETVPLGVNPLEVWEAYDDTMAGWVFIWYPYGDVTSGRAYAEFERAHYFEADVERILKAMKRWPLEGSPEEKKQAVSIALLHLFCECMDLIEKV